MQNTDNLRVFPWISALPKVAAVAASVFGFAACASIVGLDETGASLATGDNDSAIPSDSGSDRGAIAFDSGLVGDTGSAETGIVPGDSGAPVDGCVPLTNAACGANKCGNIPNGCGGTVACGTCGMNEDCVFASNTFTCKARAANCNSCADLGKNCGTVANNCQQNLDCGICGAPNSCGGGGVANVCGCTKTAQATACNGKCGNVADGCGGTWACNGCTAPNSCGGAGVANVCGCTKTAQATACNGNPCATVGDGCGGTYACPALAGHVCYAGADCTPLVCGANCGFVAQGCGLGEAPCDGFCSAGRTCEPFTATRNRCVIGGVEPQL